MPGGTFYIKRGDRLPVLAFTLTDGNGNPVNLTGATVTLNMVNQAGSLVISDAACVVDSALGGTGHYAWGGSDTTTVGTYYAEIAVSNAGLEETFPNDSNITV